MTKDWRGVHLDSLVARWQEFYPERYWVDSTVFATNTIDNPTFDWGASLVLPDSEGGILGFVAIKKPPTRFHKVGDPDAMHVSAIAFTEPSVGVDLFGTAKSMLKDRGISRLIFGTDSRHFFPGLPTDIPQLVDFLTIQGFEFVGEQIDLERDVADYELSKPLPDEVEFRPLLPSDHDSLVNFLEAEFPGRWKYDTLWKIEKEGRYDFVFGLIHERRIKGFAILQDETHKCPIGGAVWRSDLGENWGSLGPIGVSASSRGLGWGGALLGASLDHLRQLGCRRTIIDWTTLEEFYGKHGFAATRHYKSARLDLI